MEKISWTDCMRTEEVLHGDKEERNIVYTITRWKCNCIDHVLHRNCSLLHVVEGKIEGGIEVTGRRGRKRKQLLEDFREKRGYWKLKEEALDRNTGELGSEEAMGLSSHSLLNGKAIPLQAWTGPECFRRLRITDFKTLVT